MNYLFFDLEMVGSCNYICEFGYVVTNENFEIIETDNLIINPKISKYYWNKFVVDKILTRSISEYESSYDFKYYYPKIISLLKQADRIIGHTTSSDVIALNGELERYEYQPYDFKFYDIKELYKKYKNIHRNISLDEMTNELDIKGKDQNIHDAKADATNTMLCLKQMLLKLNITLDEIIKEETSFNDETNDFVIKSLYEHEIRRENEEKFLLSVSDGTNFLDSEHRHNRTMFSIFIKNVKPKKKKGTNKLKGKKVSISSFYTKNHYRQLLNLIQIILNEGGTFENESTKANLFVKYDLENEDGIEDHKLKFVLQANEKGSKIEIITLVDFLKILCIDEEKLDSLPFPSFDFLYNSKAIIPNPMIKKAIKRELEKKTEEDLKSYNKKNTKVTLGDMFPDDFDKFYESLDD